jgi:hypothetical protein
MKNIIRAKLLHSPAKQCLEARGNPQNNKNLPQIKNSKPSSKYWFLVVYNCHKTSTKANEAQFLHPSC